MTSRWKTWLPQKNRLAMLILAGSFLIGWSNVSWAQSRTPGLTIFSGVKQTNELKYLIDGNQPGNRRARYYLGISGRKMQLAVSEFEVLYPKKFRGRFDPERVEVRLGKGRARKGQRVASEVVWDPNNACGLSLPGTEDEYCRIEIYLDQSIPANTGVVLVFDRVKNPNMPGTHYFHGRVRTPGDQPFRSYVGTWIVQAGL
ncbi:MAG: DUF2808 domain-containing protein [Cyanobacteria bacterium P01_F01_bin.86]